MIAANAQQVADYRAGKEKAFNSLVGQVMKATKGKANPQQVNDILKRKLSVAALQTSRQLRRRIGAQGEPIAVSR